MPKYNFDQYIDRRGTHCKKVDMLDDLFGRHDLLPLWIADMDFPVCPEISDALVSRFGDHPIYGYTLPYDEYWQSIIDWQRRRNGFEISRMTSIGNRLSTGNVVATASKSAAKR